MPIKNDIDDFSEEARDGLDTQHTPRDQIAICLDMEEKLIRDQMQRSVRTGSALTLEEEAETYITMMRLTQHHARNPHARISNN